MKIAFAGDWHANRIYARKAIQFAAKNDAEYILHVGDFGFWPDYRGNDPFVNNVQKVAEDNGVQVLFVDGNHENHDMLRAVTVDQGVVDEPVKIQENVYYLPRSLRFFLDGVSFMALGGAHSIDRDARVEGFDWFPDEKLSIVDCYRACVGGVVDVMITHDCPAGVDIPSLRKTAYMVSQKDADATDNHRALLRNVVDVVKPKLLVHGHYHEFYGRILDGDGYGYKTRVIGLDCDGSPLNHNIIVVDTEDLRVVE